VCFYRAMHFSAKRGIAITCRLSVHPSVCDVGDCDHIGWNSEIISPLVSLGLSFSAYPKMTKGNTRKFAQSDPPPVGLSVGDIRSQIAAEWLLLHTRFRLALRLMTLNFQKFQFSRNFAWFCRFARQQRLNDWRYRPVLSATECILFSEIRLSWCCWAFHH